MNQPPLLVGGVAEGDGEVFGMWNSECEMVKCSEDVILPEGLLVSKNVSKLLVVKPYLSYLCLSYPYLTYPILTLPNLTLPVTTKKCHKPLVYLPLGSI